MSGSIIKVSVVGNKDKKWEVGVLFKDEKMNTKDEVIECRSRSLSCYILVQQHLETVNVGEYHVVFEHFGKQKEICTAIVKETLLDTIINGERAKLPIKVVEMFGIEWNGDFIGQMQNESEYMPKRKERRARWLKRWAEVCEIPDLFRLIET